MSFGVGEGCSCDEWFCDSSPYRFFFTEPQKFPKPPQGESFEDVMARTKNFAQEIIEPKVGTKFRTNARNAQTSGKSIRAIRQKIKTKIPVKSEIRNLIEI